MFIIQRDRKAEQERVNITNVRYRHCRIGKVRERTGVRWLDYPVQREPRTYEQVPWWMQGPWCGQTTSGGYVRESRADEVMLTPSHGVAQ